MEDYLDRIFFFSEGLFFACSNFVCANVFFVGPSDTGLIRSKPGFRPSVVSLHCGVASIWSNFSFYVFRRSVFGVYRPCFTTSNIAARGRDFKKSLFRLFPSFSGRHLCFLFFFPVSCAERKAVALRELGSAAARPLEI